VRTGEDIKVVVTYIEDLMVEAATWRARAEWLAKDSDFFRRSLLLTPDDLWRTVDSLRLRRQEPA
jgi:hypothetical protein